MITRLRLKEQGFSEEYYGNSRHRKNCGKPIYRLAINPTGGMVDEGERACPGEGARW